MEDMDIDQVVEIPDTPDRFTLSHVTARNWHPRGRNLSLGGRLRSFGSTDEECSELVRNGSRVGDENGHDSRLQCRPSRSSINIDDSRSARNLMPENPHASRNGHLFRRPVMGRNNKIEDTINARALNMDKGKNLCIEVPYNSPSAKDNAFVDLCSPDGRNEMAFPSNLSNGIGDESRKGKVATSGTSSLQSSPNSPKISRKGKEKVADCSSRGSGPAMDRGKQSSHICNSPRMREIFMPPPPSGVGGRKRLVRNGCISPHNIAIRARQQAECNRKSSRSVDENDTINEIPDNTSYPVDISELVSEDKDGDGADRRENALQPSNTRERDRMPSRSNGGSGCVMDEHNQIRIEQADISNGISYMNRAHSGGRAAPGASWRAFGSDRVSGPSHTANTVIKRQKKHGANNRNHAESSTSVHEDSEIGCIDESGVSENARTSAMHTRQNQSLLHPIIEIDDSPPVMTHSERQDIGCVDDDDTVARRRQIEADEMLARELQEQLYCEEPESLRGPVDEFLAMALQQEESPEQEETIRAAFRGRQPVPRSRAPMIVHSRRRPPSVPFQSTSYRRGTQPRGPSSSRMTQLRNRARRQPPAFPRGGNLEFPFDMDLDMRIDMLEALEAAAGDLGDTRLDNRILQFQHDFNENDYEMLLALDENNHNVGVSASQLNTLPLSTVQTDNFDETCAICLETPSAGETIRHLPCLHKFHKDCIDPWISRKSSCPVCKFSIT